MKRELGWLRIGSGLVLSLLFLIVLPACTKPLIQVSVDAKCGPEAIGNEPPTGGYCEIVGGKCQPDPEGCICKKK